MRLLAPGAHGYANGYRYSNALRIKTYIERMHLIIQHSAFSPSPLPCHRESSQTDPQRRHVRIHDDRLAPDAGRCVNATNSRCKVWSIHAAMCLGKKSMNC
ncbi:MAG: hypothetical protein MZV64_23855 [Ignavibacteriales bacterium]|nr:hypothetical protein [Ignavibacteriales bacterium]